MWLTVERALHVEGHDLVPSLLWETLNAMRSSARLHGATASVY